MSNEVILQISGDSGAVKQAVKAARDVGLALLETMGRQTYKNKGNAYIILMNIISKGSNIHYISLSRQQ